MKAKLREGWTPRWMAFWKNRERPSPTKPTFMTNHQRMKHNQLKREISRTSGVPKKLLDQ